MHHALDAPPKGRNIEVDEQSDGPSAELQVGQHLGIVNREQALYRFQLHHNRLLDEEIQPISTSFTSLRPLRLCGESNDRWETSLCRHSHYIKGIMRDHSPRAGQAGANVVGFQIAIVGEDALHGLTLGSGLTMSSTAVLAPRNVAIVPDYYHGSIL